MPRNVVDFTAYRKTGQVRYLDGDNDKSREQVSEEDVDNLQADIRSVLIDLDKDDYAVTKAVMVVPHLNMNEAALVFVNPTMDHDDAASVIHLGMEKAIMELDIE